ncbi:MAG: hypothetical protein Q4P23_06735, partial [Micrococcaceae bacterium]|nr:hypothetical protein [Micrococcaceae bacterium]
MQTLLKCHPVTRDQIERGTGIRLSSLTKLVEDLKQRKLVMEGETIQVVKRGRPRRPLQLSDERWMLFGAVLDRHAIQGVVSFLDLRIVERKEFPIPIEATLDSYLEHLESVAEWAASVAEQHGMELLAVELASPGATSRPTGEVIRALPNAWEHLELAS